jgi:hypothetical protein
MLRCVFLSKLADVSEVFTASINRDDSDDGGGKHLWNVWKFPRDFKLQYPRRPSYLLLREPQISSSVIFSGTHKWCHPFHICCALCCLTFSQTIKLQICQGIRKWWLSNCSFCVSLAVCLRLQLADDWQFSSFSGGSIFGFVKSYDDWGFLRLPSHSSKSIATL